jgi:G patch domain/KOW motif-containing protein
MSDSKQGKIAIQLTKKKKNTNKPTALTNEFGNDDDTKPITSRSHYQPSPERTSPLVIPLTQPTVGPLDKLKQEDAEAAQALMDSAARHYDSQQTTNETNYCFSASDGNFRIPSSGENTFTRQEAEKDAQQLQRDLQTRAPDVAVDSSVYTQVPIAEFGAALLRGMGWKGDDVKNKKEEDSMTIMPRPHRLGLGATPTLLLPELSSHKMKRPDQVQREERLKQQHAEYQAKRQEQIRRDKQKTLQIGSIVRIDQDKRGKMVQLLGVPGLNQVLVQYEGETSNTSVKKASVVLVSREELEEQPYQEAKQEEKVEQEMDVKNDGRKRIKREEHDDNESHEHDRRAANADKRQGRHHSSKDSSSRNDYRETKRRRTESEHWLIPNIRVRVVTKKLSSRQYKQKGLVLDVTHRGAYATLQMSDGQILDRVPERYLETALPKVGGNAIILTGSHRLCKGKLLERNSDSGQGVVQVFEDMNVVKLSLDDMAEWCRPLDDDIEL